MRKFDISEVLSKYSLEHLFYARDCLFKLAAEGPVENWGEVGICKNFKESMLATGVAGVSDDTMDLNKEFSSYRFIGSLFDVVTENHRSYPLKEAPSNWEVRKQWCAIFAHSITTQVMEVPEELMETLKEPKLERQPAASTKYGVPYGQNKQEEVGK